jgi:hypothetical protein
MAPRTLPGALFLDLRHHLARISPRLTTSRASPSRGFRCFAVFISFCMFSPQVEILVKRTGIWLTGGARVAIRRRLGPQFSMYFCVFPPTTENEKNTENLRFSKPLLIYCCLGASWELPGEKNVTSFVSWVEKARKNCSSDTPGGSLCGPPDFKTHTLDRSGSQKE